MSECGSEKAKILAPTYGDMHKINSLLRNKVSAEDVYVFSIKLCNNMIDKDYERFSLSALEDMKSQFVGRQGVLSVNGKTLHPRIISAWVEVVSDQYMSSGEPFCELWAKAFLLKNSNNADAINVIHSGEYKEVSVGCSIGRVVCSICGKEACNHVKGEIYSGAVAHKILFDVKDVYEWAVVKSTQNVSTLEEKLKPCPFCGMGEAGTHWHHGYWSVVCGYLHDGSPSDHCFQDWGEFETEQDAIDAWNSRRVQKPKMVNGMDYSVLEEDRRLQSLAKYLESMVGKPMYTREERNPLIEKMNIRQDGHLQKRFAVLATWLEGSDLPYGLHERPVYVTVDGKRKHYRVWEVVRLVSGNE